MEGLGFWVKTSYPEFDSWGQKKKNKKKWSLEVPASAVFQFFETLALQLLWVTLAFIYLLILIKASRWCISGAHFLDFLAKDTLLLALGIHSNL